MSKFTDNELKDEPLLPSSTTTQVTTSAPSKFKRRALLCFAFLALLVVDYHTTSRVVKPCLRKLPGLSKKDHSKKATSSCPQAEVLVPEKNSALWDSLTATYSTDAFQSRAVEWLGGAVRVP